MTKQSNTTRPNILVITTDQQRFDTLGVTGNSIIRTPRLDKLAGEGVIFNRAYCQNPVCVPSRACLHTGRYTHQHGVQYMETEVDQTPPLPPWEKTFMERLQDDGYYTGAVGKIHMIQPKGYHETALTGGKGARWTQPYGQDIGPGPLGALYARWLEDRHPGGYELIYEQRRSQEYEDSRAIINVLPEDEYVESWTAENACEFLEKRKERSQPFLLWVGFCGPHPPFDPPKRYADMYPIDDMPLPKSFSPPLQNIPDREIQRLKKITSYYYAMMTCIDDRVGTILDKLSQTGLMENTIVIVTTDHGEMLGERNRFGKGCFYEPVSRVPMIIYHPAHKDPFQFDGLVENFSIAPTILDFCGVEKPAEMTAESLVPVLFNHASGSELILSEYVSNDQGKHEICIRTSRYKLIRSLLATGESSYELFDLQEDPFEKHNRYYDPKYSKTQEEMKDLLIEKLMESMTPECAMWMPS
jgi:arylsulfatase